MDGHTVFEAIEITKQEIINCSYSNWYAEFKGHAIETIIIKPLPQEFINYLSSESIRLPKDSREENIISNSDNEYSDWESEDENQLEKQNPTEGFEGLHHEILASIEKLGGTVTPKLNWSAPKDAKWIMVNNSIKCNTANDIYLLLNSSDHIVHDLDYAFEECMDKDNEEIVVNYELVLRKWIDINPALEFRVFIKDNRIIGISQRDLNYYDYLESLNDKFNEKISSFVNNVVKASKFNQPNYILDIYIPRPFNRIIIIDINPFTRKTDSLLFTWNELLTNTSQDYEFRLINKTNLNQFSKKEFSESQVPIDVIDATMNSESMIQLAKEWNELQAKTEEN